MDKKSSELTMESILKDALVGKSINNEKIVDIQLDVGMANHDYSALIDIKMEGMKDGESITYYANDEILIDKD